MEDLRKSLIKAIRDKLESRGFMVSDPELDGFGSFDLIGRRDDERYILKILQNVDTFKIQNAEEIMRLGRITTSLAMVIGERGGSGPLQGGVVYYRHHVPILSPETFLEYVDGETPYVYSGPGGFYVPIDGEMMRHAREELGYSIGFLSNKIGTSRRSISLYESGSAATVDMFLKLESLLMQDIRRAVDMLRIPWEPEPSEAADFPNSFIEEVFTIMIRGGYDFQSVRRSPFDGIAYGKVESLLLVGLFENTRSRMERAAAIRNVSEIFENIPLVISKTNSDKENIGGCPVVNLSELRNVSDKDDLVRLLIKKSKYDH